MPEPLPSFVATVEIDEAPSGKRFQGVWLAREDGERWVIDYRPSPLWRTVDGVRVNVSGEVWSPEGQAISATHFRVAALDVVEPTPDHAIIHIGAARTMEGHFETKELDPRRKGGTFTRFVSSDAPWLIGGGWDLIPQDHTALMTVEAREVEPSNFVSRMTGPTLWLLAVAPAADATP